MSKRFSVLSTCCLDDRTWPSGSTGTYLSRKAPYLLCSTYPKEGTAYLGKVSKRAVAMPDNEANTKTKQVRYPPPCPYQHNPSFANPGLSYPFRQSAAQSSIS